MTVFRYSVVNFKKINLKGITKFCEKFNADVKMSVKMDSNGIGIKIFDENSKASICTYGVREITKEDKEKFISEENDDFDQIYADCDYDLSIKTENENEIKLAYLFGMYIASCTRMFLVNIETGEAITGEKLLEIDEKKLNRWIEQYKLRDKYIPEIAKWREISSKAFVLPWQFWVLLIFGAIIAAGLLVAMIEVAKVENGFILALPFIILGLLVALYFVRNAINSTKATKELRRLNYEYDKDLCELFGNRIPKKPSGKRKDTKQTIINLMGILILPTLIGGSIIMTFFSVILGFIIIAIPWVVLILIKFLITDVNENKLKADVFAWLDECVKAKVDKSIIALSFEIYEKGNNKWEVEVIGCTEFSLDNNMWTRNNICEINCPRGKFSYITSWEGMHYLMGYILDKYIDESENGEKLKKYKAIAVGFNDGKAELIYMKKEKE